MNLPIICSSPINVKSLYNKNITFCHVQNFQIISLSISMQITNERYSVIQYKFNCFLLLVFVLYLFMVFFLFGLACFDWFIGWLFFFLTGESVFLLRSKSFQLWIIYSTIFYEFSISLEMIRLFTDANISQTLYTMYFQTCL